MQSNMIPQTFIDDIQARTNIVEIISGYIPVKQAGRNFKALCPFHGEKTPSFMISPQKQIFHCFGCGEGGGAIQFVMRYEKATFIEAIEILAKRLGLVMPQQSKENTGVKTALYDVLNEAALFFQHNLIADENAGAVRAYLVKRGITEETIKKFRLGYALSGNSLLNHLRSKHIMIDAMEKTSLVISQRDGYRDLFWDRLMFPICDARGRVVAFGGRIYRQKIDAPKYINSPEHVLYKKREHLFGLNFAKDDIVKKDEVIVVEGYLDMITPFVHGIGNIVASLGTALTVEQMNLIRRYTSNVVLVFDADKAGEMATLRTLDLLLENDLKVTIAKLPGGADPDSLVREKGKEGFFEVLNKKKDFFEYKADILKNIYDVDRIEGKTKIIREMLSSIDKLKSEVEKYEYINKLSGSVKVREEILIAEYKKEFSKKQQIKAEKKQIDESFLSEQSPLSVTEKVILKFMLTNKKACSLIQKNIREDDFTSPVARSVFSYFRKQEVEDDFSLARVMNSLQDKAMCGLIARITMEETIPFTKEDIKTSILKMREKRAKEAKSTLRERIRLAEKQGDREQVQALMGQYTQAKGGVSNG